MTDSPRRRQKGLVTRRLESELLVYDLDRHRAHSLSPTAARVFELADGTLPVDELARRLGAEFAIDDPRPVVDLALARLAAAQLLESHPGRPRISRRKLLRDVTIAAVLMPVVQSLTAPTALAAASRVTFLECTLTLPPCPNVPCSDSPGTFCTKLIAICKCS